MSTAKGEPRISSVLGAWLWVVVVLAITMEHIRDANVAAILVVVVGSLGAAAGIWSALKAAEVVEKLPRAAAFAVAFLLFLGFLLALVLASPNVQGLAYALALGFFVGVAAVRLGQLMAARSRGRALQPPPSTPPVA